MFIDGLVGGKGQDRQVTEFGGGGTEFLLYKMGSYSNAYVEWDSGHRGLFSLFSSCSCRNMTIIVFVSSLLVCLFSPPFSLRFVGFEAQTFIYIFTHNHTYIYLPLPLLSTYKHIQLKSNQSSLSCMHRLVKRHTTNTSSPSGWMLSKNEFVVL